jgi:hypothetical protein
MPSATMIAARRRVSHGIVRGLATNQEGGRAAVDILLLFDRCAISRQINQLPRLLKFELRR